ncbi:hypothetical protein [Ramlibacter sp. Leaf400]|uniref:hypothetical protein n=1 Tax=Ramlibacter sp. Leaf400 TaxID=1736365 RepID=UPI0012E37D9E|nr:hypothetical protein [Ramlibacter sp. Leaf400]
MKFLRVAFCICLFSTLGGCAVYTPGVAVVVDPAGSHAPAARGGFCPPGQAKKGNC